VLSLAVVEAAGVGAGAGLPGTRDASVGSSEGTAVAGAGDSDGEGDGEASAGGVAGLVETGGALATVRRELAVNYHLRAVLQARPDLLAPAQPCAVAEDCVPVRADRDLAEDHRRARLTRVGECSYQPTWS
jgi:hypothetical protein